MYAIQMVSGYFKTVLRFFLKEIPDKSFRNNYNVDSFVRRSSQSLTIFHRIRPGRSGMTDPDRKISLVAGSGMAFQQRITSGT
jgi:hypothetical protein